jgi:hypothetical protein
VRLRVDVLGGVLGLLIGWGVLGSPAFSLIARLASRGADSLARFGDRAAPAGLAFGLMFGFLLWSLAWTIAGVACARAYTALRLRRSGGIRRAA